MLKAAMAISLLLVSFPRMAAAQQEAREMLPEEAGLRLKFNNATLAIVLEDYGDKTGRTLLQAPNLPKVTVTLRSQTELTVDEYLKAIETVLGMHGIAVLKVDDKFAKVVPVASARQEAMPIREELAETPLRESGELVSQMIPLRHIDIHEAKSAVEALKHAYGQIHLFERTNSILVTDTSSNINRIMQIIRHIDQPIEASEVPNVINIHHASAADIKKKLEEIIADTAQEAKRATVPEPKKSGTPGVVRRTPPGVIRARQPVAREPNIVAEIIEQAERGIIRGRVKIIADERTNILIIITRRENMEYFFEPIIKVLDVETTPDVMIKVIRLEFAEAKTVADMLNELIGAASPKADAKPAVGADAETEEPGARSAALREYLAKQRVVPAATERKSKVGELSKENIKILSNERTNSLIIMARKSDLQAIEDIIKDMDIMLSQVLIEVVIFKITLLDSFERGVDWIQRAMITYDENSRQKRSAVVAFAGAAGGDKYRAGMKDPLSATALSDLSSVSGNLTYYFTFFGLNLDAIIKIIASDNRSKIVSSPVILTTDNKEATIHVTKEKYFFKGLKYVSTSGGTAGQWVDDVEMRKVGTKLTVTPHINEKKFVVMDITQTLEEEGAAQSISGSGGLTAWPTVDSSELTASVAVRSGETIVLGGLVAKSKIRNENKIPVLGDIPLLGNLFKYSKDVDSRDEVVVFITPHVLDTPEEIEAEAMRRKDQLDVDDIWPKSSGSKLVGRDRPADGKKKTKRRIVRKEAPAPDEVAVEEEPEPDPLLNLDPGLADFIKRQEKQWGGALRRVDKRMESDRSVEP